MNIGVAPNGDPDGSNWAILFGGFEEDEDDDEAEEYVGIVALTDDTDLPGVTQVEHRFELFEDSAEDPHAVYFGAALHRHNDEDGPGCETFHAEDGQADLDDVPDDLVEGFADIMDMEIYAPGEEPVDAEPVSVSELLEPDTDPGGMFQ